MFFGFWFFFNAFVFRCVFADVCVLLLVFNAAQFCPQILSLFEEHIRRHYRYLRDTISNFVPHLQV